MGTRTLALIFTALTVACGGSPVRPSGVTSAHALPSPVPAATTTALVAVPLLPANDAQIGNSAQPGFPVSITLIAQDSGTAAGVVVDTFHVARDRNFTVAVQTMTVPRGS